MSQESCSTKPTGHRLGKSFLPVVFSGIIVIILVPIWIAGTGSYPLAVVDGNSMNPTLHSGDLLYYAASSKPIVNGTIIIVVQDSNGIPAFNAVTKPVIIHRVIGTGREPDGSLYYETKG